MHPWERYTKEVDGHILVEPMDAYDSFCIYYRLATRDRSFEKVCEIQDLSMKVVVHWATVWYWANRAEAFDAHQIREGLIARASVLSTGMAEYSQARKTLAVGEKGFGLAIIDLCRARLAALDPADIPIPMIPQFIKAGLELTNSGIDNEGKALGIDRLALILQAKINKKKANKALNPEKPVIDV